MRLKQIKLAGFKSFVDPTTVPFPENLTAIVGPNGCGKSNLIDAVRWVMGESSAKNLRGDSMTDVIFNGSTSRKPVGQASIELIFDNSDGSVQGEYANYAEISVRRTVTRDGMASYHLNGTKCRRKDITDIFLGTGLGPRSYAIIEQGMISKLIESKPQDLRIFLEEAAGISKYKERRKETENRIRHTRENMERLQDIREELGKQLAHLQRQASAANKYKEYKVEERQLKAEMAAIKWRKFHGQAQALSADIARLEVELEARVAEQRHADNEIEQKRDRHIELSEEFNAAQGKYYGVGADIARLEQGIAHKRERRSQLQEDMQQVDSTLRHLLTQMDDDEGHIENLQTRLLEAEPELDIQRQTMEQAQEILADIDSSMLEWEQEWDNYNQSSAQNNQKVEVERTRIDHFEKVIERLKKRLDTNQQELQELGSEPLQASIADVSVNLAKVEEQRDSLSEKHESGYQQITDLRNLRRQRQSETDLMRLGLQQLQGQHISLSALQKAALGTDLGQAEAWLESNNINKNKRLAQQIKVDSGWELAVEMVLGDFLEAVCCSQNDELLKAFETLGSGKLSLLDLDKVPPATSQQGLPGVTPLSSKVKHADAVAHWLEGVFICHSLDEAMKLRASLQPDQSLILASGIWVGANWARVSARAASEDSVLEREAKLLTLSEELNLLEAEYEKLLADSGSEQEQLKQLESSWEEQQRQLTLLNKQHNELTGQLGVYQAKLEQLVKRKHTLGQESAEISQQLEADETLLAQSRVSLEKLLDAMAGDLAQRETLTRLREEKRNALEQARNQAQIAKDQAHRIELQVAQIRSEIASVQSANLRMQGQIGELQSRKLTLQDNLETVNAPDDDMQLELEEALEKRLEAEQALVQAKESLEEVDRLVRAFEKDRHNAEQAAQAVRSRLERLRMQWSENTTMQKNQAENLSGDESEILQLLAGIDPEASETEWEEKLSEVAARVQRLGAINLAAIEEHVQQSERKVYLDSQHEDLEESLNTLEGAIRKIDKETRTRFKETFDKVNAGMKELFPKVFGGGHAYLELTGEDLLDTGVAVMARPPGKRNSTIHLLSGGEKALTALSLVFSIFRLNPAPFCMLDEVDAPLDDANVGRFCKLVKEMSQQVQFIYITHNKVSMEMATALAGVTMQEPGASRLVAVNVEEAAKMIAE